MTAFNITAEDSSPARQLPMPRRSVANDSCHISRECDSSWGAAALRQTVTKMCIIFCTDSLSIVMVSGFLIVHTIDIQS